ncbi:MAG: PilZ domain-containing protein [Calditrichales bacterium]|nr:MAG: PilZ domain-containing protein [Calditrichales bacterium]
MSSQERKSARSVSDQFISYRLYDSEGRVCDEGIARAIDISRSGVALECRSEFAVNSKIDLTIAMTDDVVKCVGEVRNVEKKNDSTFHIGIQFTDVSEDQIEMIVAEFPDIE